MATIKLHGAFGLLKQKHKFRNVLSRTVVQAQEPAIEVPENNSPPDRLDVPEP